VASWAQGAPEPRDDDGRRDGQHGIAGSAPFSFPRIRNSKEKLRLRCYAALLALDLIAIALGFVMGNLARFGDPFSPQGMHAAMAFLPIFSALAFSGQAYSIKALRAPRDGIIRSLRAFALTACALLLVLFYMKTTADFSRVVFGIGFLTASGLIVAARYTFGIAVGRRYKWNFLNEVLLVDGIPIFPDRGQIVVFARQLGLSASANDPDSFNRIGRMLGNCDRVLLACPPERRLAWTQTLKGVGIHVDVLTPELDHLGAIEVRHSGGRSALMVAAGPLGVRDRILKRALDLAITVPALIAFAPFMIVIALAIRLTSRGPVFFRQPRVGQANRIFQVLKFRSMRVETSDSGGIRSASKDDDRITPIGLLLRRTSLDELPQLLNVFKGDMSIVGPRPHALASTAEDCLFWHIDSRYWERGAVKPGITGLAQVRGYRGATATREDLTNRLQADLEYLSNWTIWRDIAIIVRTARVLVHPNAF
jgi:lipopolysaccharide/colanic/teichoic acid biosynthesis glycosyltransferase